MRFVLASASPARLSTLRRAGVEPEVHVSGVDEDAITAQLAGCDTAAVTVALAEAKAEAVAALLTGPPAIVLGCDSLLELDGVPLGKPGSAELARERWQLQRGRTAILHTGHALVGSGTGRAISRVVSTEVDFASPDDDEIDFYVSSGEPLQVAGAFTVDGLGGWYVRGVRGDHHNVVGVSLPALREMLSELGVRVRDLPPTGGSETNGR